MDENAIESEETQMDVAEIPVVNDTTNSEFEEPVTEIQIEDEVPENVSLEPSNQSTTAAEQPKADPKLDSKNPKDISIHPKPGYEEEPSPEPEPLFNPKKPSTIEEPPYYGGGEGRR